MAAPGALFFVVFFVVPLASLFLLSLDKPTLGNASVQWMFDFRNFERFFGRAIYYEAASRSAGLAALVSLIALILGYPLAFVIAKTTNVRRNTTLMILVLSAMQLDMVIRLFGLMVLMGDVGLINEFFRWAGLIGDEPLPLMYNFAGVKEFRG